MAGTVENAKRPRYEANERFDTVDADIGSETPRNLDDALMAAAVASPRAVGGSTPTGLIITGFGLTPNPNSGTDGLVRIQSPLGVGLDANSRLLIKENGTTSDLAIPSGAHQIYAYFLETATDNATRRFLSVSAPYVDSARAIDTTYEGGVGYYVRAGDQTSILAQDVVNGATTALLFLGVASNDGTGAITIAGYNTLSAPNGAYATNRMSSVAPATVAPIISTMSGSPSTLLDLVQTLAAQLGLALWYGGSSLGAYNGNATSVGPGTLTDTNQAFVVNELTGGVLVDSTLAKFPITSNTATVVSVTGNPSVGAYNIYAPIARNNYGAFVRPTVSLDALQTMPFTWPAQQTYDVAPVAPHYRQTDDVVDLVPGCMGLDLSGTYQKSDNGFRPPGNTTDYLQYPVPVPVGHKLTQVFVIVVKNSSATATLEGTLYRSNADGTASLVVQTTNNVNAPGATAIQLIPPGEEDAQFATHYYVKLRYSAFSGATNLDTFTGLNVYHHLK